MGFKLGQGSLNKLEGVHPELVEVVNEAIEITEVDFSVVDGLRTIEEQKEYVAKGVSWTMDSKHLPQEDEFSHAVDLVPWINGQSRWELQPMFKIAEAMRAAAIVVGVDLRWGGNWSVPTILSDSIMEPERLMKAYVELRREQNRRATIDGPHYELML